MTDHPIDGRVENLSLMLDLDRGVQQAAVAAWKDVGRVAGMNKGDQLFKEGDRTADDGYVVLKGSLLVESSTGFNTTLYAPVLVGEMKQFEFGGNDKRIANVTAAAELEVLRFDWNAFYKALNEHLTESQLADFRDALRRYAWMHYLELEGEL